MANRFTIPNEVFIGTDALKSAQNSICALGKKALIVTGKSMIRQGHIETLQAMLKENEIDSVIFSDIPGEPTDVMIQDGYEVYLKNHCDFIIGFGGGSPLDSAKAIGVMVTNPGKLSDYNGKVIKTPIPPLVEIPSTAGTGSEVTPFTIINDTERDIKMLLKGPVLMPTIAIVDPAYTMSTPQSVTVATGLDALTHAIEAYTSKKAFSQTDIYAVSAIKRIFSSLPDAVRNGENEYARTQMSIAAYEAGISFSNSSVTIVHGMSRPIGALFHVPHGISNAMLLAECLRFVMDGAMDRFADLGRAIGVAETNTDPEIAAELFVDAVSRLCAFCKVPTLTEYGIDREKFVSLIDKMSNDAVASGSPANTRKEIRKEDIMKIYVTLIDR